MPLPRDFLGIENFRLAFWRIVKSSKKDYKQYYRHSFQSYSLSLDENLTAIITQIRRGVYEPSAPTIVFHPKKSGVLRPLTLLTFKDLIVYQAVVNIVADKMMVVQEKYAFKKCYGAILSIRFRHYFFNSWRICYKKFNQSVCDSYACGNVFVADFDLVACYELIDHGILRSCIADKVKSEDLLEFLFKCLSHWTTNSIGKHLRHGIPQGPDASSFLAECVLFRFDATPFRDAQYFRYIDDIKLMAKDTVPLRRALLRLDLKCKELGLVPQAQKITLGKIDKLEHIIKSVPSLVIEKVEKKRPGSHAELDRLFRASIAKKSGRWDIIDVTKFKYALGNMNPRLAILRRIGPMLAERPDLSPTFANYLRKFKTSKPVADLLLETLKCDPIYDASAADYIRTMDCCEPLSDHREYRRVVSTARKRSEENSILIRIAALTFRGKRKGPKDAMKLIAEEHEPLVRNMVLHALFGATRDAPFKLNNCRELLQNEVDGDDEDLARYCGLLLILDSYLGGKEWMPGRAANGSVKLLAKGLGLRSRMPASKCVLDGFFDKYGVRVTFSWRKALGGNLKAAEHKCLRLLQFEIGDPTAKILMLDTFNEILVQSFSNRHPTLQGPYSKAAGKNTHPDYGNWLNNGTFKTVMANCVTELLAIHKARVGGDLAHAKSKSGRPTRAISFDQARRHMGQARKAWKILVREWSSIL